MIKLPYKNLKIWQKSMELAKYVYAFTKKFPPEELYGLTSQVRRSVISVPSNIAEGSQRSSDKDFAKFILIAKGSLAELETQIILSESFGYLKSAEMELILVKTDELDKMVLAFHKKLTAPRFSLTATKK